MSQCIREKPKRSILHNRTSNTGGQGLNRQYHDGGAEAPWQLHAPRRKTLTVGTKSRSNRSLDRAVLPRLSKGLSLEGRASRAPEARRAAGGATADCAKAFKSRPSERAWGRPLKLHSNSKLVVLLLEYMIKILITLQTQALSFSKRMF